MHEERTKRLGAFVEWAKQHISGDEKGEAQIFLDRLFQAFGQQGVREAGASFEYRVKNTRGGTAFADCVWKPTVLIEMKKRGVDLTGHLQQAFDYWARLCPGRPRYVILCNFDEFRIYDFDVDLFEPQDIVVFAELPQRYLPLAFLFPTAEKPQFRIDRVKVTRAAADKLAAVYNRLAAKPAIGPEMAQRFVLQMLVALFSQSIGFVPKGFISQLLADCTDPPKSFDLLQGLFNAMNTDGGVQGGRFRSVPYFNGGLFAHPAPVELDPEYEGLWLREAAENDWSAISPDIFGTLFQHSMGKKDRHAFGAHYTAPTDIMKIVKPTIVDPFHLAIDKADTLKELAAIRRRLQTLRVLDPACGSGNFLYIAYRQMRRLEVEINVKENELSKRQHEGQMSLAGVSPMQFFGLDILPFAVELAKVTLAIAPKLASDELHTSEPTLPLYNLDKNIRRIDALIDSLGNPIPWPAADVIIGNPPFLGSRYFAKEHGYDYVRRVYAAYPDVPKMADYCVYWFRRAHDHLPECTPDDPVAGRAGLVATQNVRNNQSRVGGLDHIAKTGTIVEAVDNQPWSGEANVHVSIVNWIKTQDGSIVPPARRLWSKVESAPRKRRAPGGNAAKEYELNCRNCEHINSALSDELNVSEAAVLACNSEPKRCYVGQYPFNEGFLLDPAEAARQIARDPRLADVLFPYMIGRDLVEDGKASRWIIDFGQRPMLDAASYAWAFERVKERVMPEVLAKAEAERITTGKDSTRWTRLAQRWWQFRDYQPGTMAAIANLPRYAACSRVTKRPIFEFISSEVHPDNTLMVFPFADDYSFGIIKSSAHWLWFTTKCSKLTERFRYTADSVFDTFPWPQSPTVKQIDAVAAAAVNLRRIRTDALAHLKGGLRALYRTLELPGANPLKDAHADLDAAVLAAYGFSAKKDLLAQLLELNLSVAAAEKAAKSVTPPGIPAAHPNPARLVTEDCIRP